MFNDFEEEFAMGVKKKQPGLPVKAVAKPAASKPVTEVTNNVRLLCKL
jgi:hypothetical protein